MAQVKVLLSIDERLLGLIDACVPDLEGDLEFAARQSAKISRMDVMRHLLMNGLEVHKEQYGDSSESDTGKPKPKRKK